MHVRVPHPDAEVLQDFLLRFSSYCCAIIDQSNTYMQEEASPGKAKPTQCGLRDANPCPTTVTRHHLPSLYSKSRACAAAV